MSERIRKSAKTSFLASKRLVISACAAIAMVLGAVSSGASFIPSSSAAPQSNTDKVLQEDGAATQVKEGIFNKQHAIEAQNLLTTPATPNAAPEKRTSPATPAAKAIAPSILTTTQAPRDVIASDTAAGGSTTSSPATTTPPSDAATTTPTEPQPTDDPPADDTNPPKPSDDSDPSNPTNDSLSVNNQQTQ